MFLSFIVPVYNTEEYLAECLDSLLTQDIPYNDYEIICVNDGSTDGSRKILKAYSERYSNIVVVDKENGGISSARNAGYPYVHGDYIWFVDSDDFIQSNVLSLLQELISAKMCDRLQIGSYVFNEALTDNEKYKSGVNQLKVNSHFYNSVVWTSIFKRDFLLDNDCRFHYTELTHGEDTLFMYEFLSHGPTTEVYDAPCYFYRIRSGSLQTSKNQGNKSKYLSSYLRVVEIMKHHYANATPSNKEAAANTLMIYLWNALLCSTQVHHNTRKYALNKLKEIKMYPYCRPSECTQIKSYQTTRTDIVGKVYDILYLHLHRPWGFFGMLFLQRLISLKHHLRK